MDRIPPTKDNTHETTSYYNYEGLDLSLAAGIWKRKARSDCRLILMKKLLDIGIGFNELEHFNEALHLKIRSETLKKRLRGGDEPREENCERGNAIQDQRRTMHEQRE